jgi:hypothetical protein
MPFYLSLFSFLASLIWMIYGILGRDPYITVSMQSGFTILVSFFREILILLSFFIYNFDIGVIFYLQFISYGFVDI